jgi:hypothetical protein
MNKLAKLAVIIASSIGAMISAQADPYAIGQTVFVQEAGVSPNHIVTIKMTGAGYDTVGTWDVYAGITQLKIGASTVNSFCIDPYQWSSGDPTSYTVKNLAEAPVPYFQMTSAAAQTVNNLWANFYQLALGNADQAAGLQIAIWETVAGSRFSVVGSDYGAAGMITSVHSQTADAGLVALSSRSFQDYVVQNVPDAGTTLVLLGLGLVALVIVGYKARSASKKSH